MHAEIGKLRIALVIERMDLARGGRERSTAQIAQTLARRGHEVTILCQEGSWEGGPVEVLPLGGQGLLRVTRLRHFVADVQEHICQADYDIVHAMLPVPGANVYQPRGGTVPAQREASVRRHGLIGRTLGRLGELLNICRRQMEQLERVVVADENVLCLAVSQMVGMEFVRHYGRSRGVRVIYNAVDVPDPDLPQRPQWRRDRRSELGVDEDALVFLIVATNFELKGVAEAIVAFARWYDSIDRAMMARLVVVGREMPEAYQQVAGMRSIAAEVVFVPPTDEIFQWYAAADAVVLLSWYDPCSRVVLEAVRWGVPAITTACNGAAELLAAGAGAVVESPRDSSGIVAAMGRMADPARRGEMARACLDVADRASMDRHVDELLEAYAAVLMG